MLWMDGSRGLPIRMQRYPNDLLTRLRSRAEALRDLIETHERLAVNDPVRAELGRMIRQLAVEVTCAWKLAPAEPDPI